METFPIDKEIVKLSGKKNPDLLFIPTASGDSNSYTRVVKKHFGERLGCNVEPLYLINKKYSLKELSDKILGTDIIYVGGGNTLKMLQVWRSVGVDKILRKAYENGVTLSGVSAGAICWFTRGQSDSLSFTSEPKKEWDYIIIKGLGLIDGMIVPHFAKNNERARHLSNFLKNNPVNVVAISDCAAVEIIDDEFRIITSSPHAGAYKAYRKDGRIVFEKIIKTDNFSNLNMLFSNDL